MKVLRNGRAVELPEPPPDPREPKGCPTPGACSCIAPDSRDATIARLSADLALTREALGRYAALDPDGARAVLANLSKGT